LGGDFHAELDGDTARLHIHQVYPEDEGEYTCVAYNELGRALTSACLVVDGKKLDHLKRRHIFYIYVSTTCISHCYPLLFISLKNPVWGLNPASS
jgi:hypothetical protein